MKSKRMELLISYFIMCVIVYLMALVVANSVFVVLWNLIVPIITGFSEISWVQGFVMWLILSLFPPIAWMQLALKNILEKVFRKLATN